MLSGGGIFALCPDVNLLSLALRMTLQLLRHGHLVARSRFGWPSVPRSYCGVFAVTKPKILHGILVYARIRLSIGAAGLWRRVWLVYTIGLAPVNRSNTHRTFANRFY